MKKDLLKLGLIALFLVAIACICVFMYNVVSANFPPPSNKPPSHSKGAGVTAQCRDLMYSYSTSRAGTCAGHGGVKEYY